MINRSYLAVFYYNLQKPNFYNLDNQEDRKRAERNFANSKTFDKVILEKAFENYKQFLDIDFQNLLKEKI